MHSTREPLQFGAEIYGHAGLEADLEVQDLALDCLRRAGIQGAALDLADARIVRSLLAPLKLTSESSASVYGALAAKDAAQLRELAAGFPDAARRGLLALLSFYGDRQVLAAARRELPALPAIHAALDDLQWLATHAEQAHPEVEVGFDLADLSGYAYYSGAHFTVYAAGSSDALLRGGRYDEVGAVFGRNRPAVGFSLDVKELAALAPAKRLSAAIRAPWAETASLRAAVRGLREQGDTVVCVLPGHEHEAQEFDCDRELVADGDRWAVRAL
jgi:ATP phosphoribosyltransferase regulatory subunit